ncbi:MAG: hypothetical protein ACPLQO_10855 [Desulfotomaculales bacterium]
MKKVIAVAAAVFFIFGSAALAREANIKQDFLEQGPRHWAPVLQKGEQLRDFEAGVREKTKVIRENNQRMKNLQGKVNRQIREIKVRLAELRKNPEKLDENKVADFARFARNFGEQQKALESVQKNIAGQKARLRNAAGNRRMALFLQALDETIAAQEKGIAILGEMSADLERLDREL